MKKHSSKGLLIPWLLRALNEEQFEGMRWANKETRTFYINWTHKSAEQWSKNDLQVYEAWAAHKGKLDGKNCKQLKATFRCALNSKKELKEVFKTRKRRYWQFVDNIQGDEQKRYSKELPGQVKLENSTQELKSDCRNISLLDSNSKAQGILPSYESLRCSVSLTPPLQADDISFGNSADASTPVMVQILQNCRNIYLTPPHQANEMAWNMPENRWNSPSPDSRLTPPDSPPMNYSSATFQNSYNPPNPNVWQPNYLTLPQIGKNNLNPLFLKEEEKTNQCMNSNDLFQSTDGLLAPKFEAQASLKEVCEPQELSCFLGTTTTSAHPSDGKPSDYSYLMNLEDPVDPVECELIIQELNRLSTSGEGMCIEN